MKKVFYLLISIICLASCTEKKCTIIATKVPQNVTHFYLSERDSLFNSKSLHKQEGIKNGEYRYESKIDGIKVANLGCNTGSNITIFLEPGTINVEWNEKEKILSYATGTPNNDLYAKIMNQVDLFYEREEAFLKKKLELVDAGKEEEAENLEFPIWDIKSEIDQRQINLTIQNPDMEASLWFYRENLNNIDAVLLNEGFQKLSDRLQQSDLGKYIKSKLKGLLVVAVGNEAPNFKLNDSKGNEVYLYNVKSKLKIIDFWASWCSPCRAKHPELKKIYDQYKYDGLEIIGVSLDGDLSKWKLAIREDKVDWIQLCDGLKWGSPVIKRWGVTGVPTVFLLDENNVVVENDYQKIVEKVKEILGSEI